VNKRGLSPILTPILTDLRLGRRRESGLVILDLYSRGIGLIEALNDDALLRLLLEQAHPLAGGLSLRRRGRLPPLPAIPARDCCDPLRGGAPLEPSGGSGCLAGGAGQVSIIDALSICRLLLAGIC
jgi:hypothetical protein